MKLVDFFALVFPLVQLPAATQVPSRPDSIYVLRAKSRVTSSDHVDSLAPHSCSNVFRYRLPRLFM